MKYDPEVGPDPAMWLELDDGDRIEAARQYHRRVKDSSENPKLHAIIHSVAETQLAEGYENTQAVLERLLREGLDRHDAIHAIGSVIAEEIFEALNEKKKHNPKSYARKLDALTASKWRSD